MAAWMLLTVVFALLWCVGALPALLLGQSRIWRRVCFGGWARAALWSSGVRMRRVGALPEGAGFLVANHQSWLDIPVLAANFDVVFISMAELARWPLIGLMARAFGTILIDRSDKRSLPRVNRDVARALERGERIAFFPEGRITDGREAVSFRPSLFAVAADGRQGVACVALCYATGPGDDPVEESVVWGARPFLAQAWRLLRQHRIFVELCIAAQPARGADRKRLAQQCEERVRAAGRAARRAAGAQKA